MSCRRIGGLGEGLGSGGGGGVEGACGIGGDFTSRVIRGSAGRPMSEYCL